MLKVILSSLRQGAHKIYKKFYADSFKKRKVLPEPYDP